MAVRSQHKVDPFERQASELYETFVNGNRNDVREALALLNPHQAAFVVLEMALLTADRTDGKVRYGDLVDLRDAMVPRL